MTDLTYLDTLITVAEDCPVMRGVVPVPRSGKKTVAVLQYEMLTAHPRILDQEDVLFESWLSRQDMPTELSVAGRERLRAEFFAKPQACLRASPLPKTYGWGLLFDSDGRVSLCPMESDEYQRLARGDGGVKVLPAMRTRRA